jgi:hypothetical protein
MGETATVKGVEKRGVEKRGVEKRGVEKRGVEKRVENGVVKEDIEMNR